jgi:four helix bundle protein
LEFKIMQNFRNLKVWQKAHELALLVYRLTADFLREETFGLRHTLRRTAVDIPAYIAEGAAKTQDREFALSINSAIGLTSKLEYYALITLDLELLDPTNHENLNQEIVEVSKMLSGFNRKLG